MPACAPPRNATCPSRYTLARRNVVLNVMADARAITATEAAAAKSEELTVLPPQKLDDTAAPYFVDYLKRELERYQINEEDRPHLRIETTLDLDLQAAANQTVREHLARLTKLVTKKVSGWSGTTIVQLSPQSVLLAIPLP